MQIVLISMSMTSPAGWPADTLPILLSGKRPLQNIVRPEGLNGILEKYPTTRTLCQIFPPSFSEVQWQWRELQVGCCNGLYHGRLPS